MAAILERIRKRMFSRDAKRAMSFHELAARIAGGNEPGQDLIDRTLDDCGKSFEELAVEVGRVEERKGFAEAVANGEAAEADIVRIDRDLAKAAAEFDAAQQAYRERIAPVEQERQRLLAVVGVANQARRNLLRTAGPEKEAALKHSQ